MKAFTLIEIALIILITSILSSISLRYTVFKGDVLYLKNFVYKLGSNFNLLKDFSLGRRMVNNGKACGYGLLFTKNDYLGYAYATTSPLDCDALASSTPTVFVPSTPFFYLHTNGEIRQEPIDPLQIKDRFLSEIRLSLDSPTCSNNLFNLYQKIALVYYNPYGDLFLLGENNGNWSYLLPSQWSNIYFCLSYKNETRVLRINQAGSIFLESP